jgi:hypothetical protein
VNEKLRVPVWMQGNKIVNEKSSAYMIQTTEVTMSFFKKLFGGGGTAPGEAGAVKSAEHKGFTIEARPYAEGGQFQLAGLIWKEIDGARKEHKFIRADKFTDKDEAADIAISKGRQIIDEQGERIFGP